MSTASDSPRHPPPTIQRKSPARDTWASPTPSNVPFVDFSDRHRRLAAPYDKRNRRHPPLATRSDAGYNPEPEQLSPVPSIRALDVASRDISYAPREVETSCSLDLNSMAPSVLPPTPPQLCDALPAQALEQLDTTAPSPSLSSNVSLATEATSTAIPAPSPSVSYSSTSVSSSSISEPLDVHSIASSFNEEVPSIQRGLLNGIQHTSPELVAADFFGCKADIDSVVQWGQHRQAKPFRKSDGKSGQSTVWYMTAGPFSLSAPPARLKADPGDLYIHWDSRDLQSHIWVLGAGGDWITVREGDQHPSSSGRNLRVARYGVPSWVTKKSYSIYRSHEKRARLVALKVRPIIF